MCGRYILRTPAHLIQKLFVEPDERLLANDEPESALSDVDAPGAMTARFNIAPTQTVAAVRADNDGHRAMAFLRWGLVPFWAKDLSVGARMINARVETVDEKPAFKTSLKNRRCLIIADGFYEWVKEGKKRRPFLFENHGGAPFAFAGLWASWGKGEDRVESCSVLTMDAVDVVRPIHDRMPLILSRDDHATWLDGKNDAPDLDAIVERARAALAVSHREVSSWVNNARHEDPGCIAPPELTFLDG